MKNKVIIYLLTLAFVFTSAANIFALASDFYDVNINELDDSNPIIDEEPDTPDPEPVEDRMLEMEEYVSTEAEENALDNEELEIAEEEILDGVQRSGDKTFTVTKKVGDTEEKVGDFDKFYDAIGSMDINNKVTFYTIYLNKDASISADERGGYHKSNNKFRLTSGQGGPFTLTREGTWGILAIQENAELTVDNIVLDGSGTSQCFFISNNGVVNIGKDATIQNFVDTQKDDGPAIFVSGGTLNILDGVTIQNNNSNTQGGVIQARNGTTVNISGGIFKNNTSNTSDGGVIAAYGTLNITGGTFEGNSAKKTGGAIIIGKNQSANISNATFRNNKARTGGAIYSLQEINASKLTFEHNEAIWGGAIFASKKLSLSDNSTFNKNKVSSAGGAIYASQGIELNNVTFNENTSDVNGGAIFASKGVELNNVIFTENTAENQGGGIYISKGDSKLEGCNFTKNGSQAIFINHDNGGTTTISKTSFTENYSNHFGGGIYLGKNAKLIVNESNFTKNMAAYGAGITSAGIVAVNPDSTNMIVEDTKFTENEALQGGGIFTAFPTQINNCKFTKNKAQIHPQDDQTNPHLSGNGGAMYVMDQKTIIKGSVFSENWSFGSGGAISINGVIRDDDNNITGLKNNLMVEISENTTFEKNKVDVGQGGAIYTIPYQYEDPITEGDAYKNLKIDNTTLFKGNFSGEDLFAPPSNYEDFTNLKFDPSSDVNHEVLTRLSLLNNYDVNYKNPNKLIVYNANGGKFADGTEIKTNIYPIDEVISIIGAPTREGYKFLYWKGSKYNPGDSYTVKDNHTFVAQWEAEEPEPQPQPYDPGYFYYEPEESKPVDRDLDVYRWYMEGNENNEFMPNKGITRAEMAQIFARALSYDGYKTYGDYNPYPDVDPNKWYYQAVVTTTEAGVFKGTDMGTFEPQREITQAELIATISRFQKLINKEGNAFEMKFDHWARPEVQAAYEEKWLELYKDGRANFSADAVITREEVATILNKAFGRPIDEKYIKDMQANIKDTEKNLKTFKDIDKDMWSYYEILAASNTFAVNYKNKEKTDYEWYNHAIEDDGPSMPVEKIRWYRGILNNDKYIDHLYQIKFQREMRRY